MQAKTSAFLQVRVLQREQVQKPQQQKNSGGYLELKDKLLTLVSKAVAKLLVFSDISKLISNF